MKRMILVAAILAIPVLGASPSALASRDPLGYVDGMSLYEYVGGRSPVLVDPSGLLERDPQTGGIVMRNTQTATVKLDALPGNKLASVAGAVTCDDGKTKITVIVLDPAITNQNVRANCHGATFGDSSCVIPNEQVPGILKGDGYQPRPTGEAPQKGDVVIWRNEKGELVHSATVDTVDPKGNVTVTQKAGVTAPGTNVPLDKAWGDPNAKREFQHKPPAKTGPSEDSLRTPGQAERPPAAGPPLAAAPVPPSTPSSVPPTKSPGAPKEPAPRKESEPKSVSKQTDMGG